MRGKSSILIAYFTWADNTTSADPERDTDAAIAHYRSVGDRGNYAADASSSASLIPPGNAAIIAGFIRDATGGDLFSIRTAQPYPSDYDECLDVAYREKQDAARP